MDTLKNKVVKMLNEATEETAEWADSRDNLPYPSFPENTTNDKAWMAGLSEGKAIGRKSILKELLKELP